MRYFYDTEFEDNGKTIIPISIGIVSEDNRELYLINKHYMNTWFNEEPYRWNNEESNPSQWVIDNVLCNITEEDVEEYGSYVDYWQNHIKRFISDNNTYTHRSEIELWGYYSSYDHVLLAQTFGPMINLPQPIPMFTNDLMSFKKDLKPEQDEAVHHALYDAQWNKKLWEVWVKE